MVSFDNKNRVSLTLSYEVLGLLPANSFILKGSFETKMRAVTTTFTTSMPKVAILKSSGSILNSILKWPDLKNIVVMILHSVINERRECGIKP